MVCNTEHGYVFILQNTLFNGVVSFDSTAQNPNDIAKERSRLKPGEFSVFSSLACENHSKVKKRILHSLQYALYAGDFYELSTQEALKVVQREVNRIPAISS